VPVPVRMSVSVLGVRVWGTALTPVMLVSPVSSVRTSAAGRTRCLTAAGGVVRGGASHAAKIPCSGGHGKAWQAWRPSSTAGGPWGMLGHV